MVEGSFSFANFYNRRIKRILPVFFITILVTIFVIWNIYSSTDYWIMANCAISSVLFISNIYFAKEGGYF